MATFRCLAASTNAPAGSEVVQSFLGKDHESRLASVEQEKNAWPFRRCGILGGKSLLPDKIDRGDKVQQAIAEMRCHFARCFYFPEGLVLAVSCRSFRADFGDLNVRHR